MSHANKVIERNIRSRRFSFLGKRKTIKTEYNIEKYKSDIYIEESNTVIEIKSILSFDKIASFPTVYSQRAINQLFILSNLLDKGYNVCYIFVVLTPKVKEIKINKEIVEYHRQFMECIHKGMVFKAYSIKLKNFEPLLNSEVCVSI